MTDLTGIREALAAVIDGVGPPGQGCRASAGFVSSVNPPAAIITPQPGPNWTQQTFDGAAQYMLRLTLLAGIGSDESADALMSAWLSLHGEQSIIAALNANLTLGGACDWCVLQSVHGYGWIEWGGLQYLGANLMLSVGAS